MHRKLVVQPRLEAPANIFRDANGDYQIGDFGLSCILNDKSSSTTYIHREYRITACEHGTRAPRVGHQRGAVRLARRHVLIWGHYPCTLVSKEAIRAGEIGAVAVNAGSRERI
jgi:serine/threonine protein kinase